MSEDELADTINATLTGSRKILDNFGITISLAGYPRLEIYRAAQVEVWGSGFWGRLWAQYLRAAFNPIGFVRARRRLDCERRLFEGWILDQVLDGAEAAGDV